MPRQTFADILLIAQRRLHQHDRDEADATNDARAERFSAAARSAGDFGALLGKRITRFAVPQDARRHDPRVTPIRNRENVGSDQIVIGMKYDAIRVVASALLAMLVLASCAPTLTATQGFPNWPPPLTTNIVGQLQAGTLTLDDMRLRSELNRSQCDFVADYSNARQPQFSFSDKGATGFLAQLVSTDLEPSTAVSNRCPPDLVIREVGLWAGPGVVIGQPTHIGNMEILFANRDVFDTGQGFFEFTLKTLDRNAGKS
jgi:hypothetical protein